MRAPVGLRRSEGDLCSPDRRSKDQQMAKSKKTKREQVWLECSECKNRNYRTSISTAEGTPKLELKKYCKSERKHTVHKIRRK